jgi:uncharacterized protein (TIGR02147 family)
MYLRELFKVKTLIPELYDYYHQWYHSAIREMVKKGAVKNDAATIAQSLVPAISEEEAKESLGLLQKLKFVACKGDMLEAVDTTEIDSQTAALSQKIHYEQMAELAAQSLYTQGPETQDFESMTLSLPMDKVAEVRRQTVRFGVGIWGVDLFKINLFRIDFFRSDPLRIDVPGKGVLLDNAIDVVKFAAVF